MELFANRHRRQLFLALAELDSHDADSIRLEEVLVDPDNQEGVLIMMHHTHLPKLEEYGIIDWEVGSDTVRRGPRFDEVESLVELLRSNGDTLHRG